MLEEPERERLELQTDDPKLYYDYEGRFVKQKLERDRMAILPRVIKPSMFAPGRWSLGGLRTSDRYTVSPVSAVTVQFLDVPAGTTTPVCRTLPSQIAFVLDGYGESLQSGKTYSFGPEDVVLVPPYVEHCWRAGGKGAFRLWIVQTRIWHVLGLLWQDLAELREVPQGCTPIRDLNGHLSGFEVPAGVLGIDQPIRVSIGTDGLRKTFFEARRSAEPKIGDERLATRYDWFLDRLAEENRIEQEGPRVVRAQDCDWEETRHGRIRFYLHPWRETVAPQLDLVVQEIEPQGFSGRHRHIAEEIVFVLEGTGCDVHEETQYPWERGDLVCVPTMASHQHRNLGQSPARLVSVWPRERMFQLVGGFEHLEEASSWRAKHSR